MSEIERLADKVMRLPPEQQLLIAYELMEKAKGAPNALQLLGIVSSTCNRIHLELESVILHARAKRMSPNQRKF